MASKWIYTNDRITRGEWRQILKLDLREGQYKVLGFLRSHGGQAVLSARIPDFSASRPEGINRALSKAGLPFRLAFFDGESWKAKPDEKQWVQLYKVRFRKRVSTPEPQTRDAEVVAHEEAKSGISDELVSKINRWKDYETLLDHICTYDPVEACALIDKLITLVSVLILLGLHLRVQEKNGRAKAILDRANVLGIRGTKGICHARDELFEQTGIFLC